jgi:hypothetical protein
MIRQLARTAAALAALAGPVHAQDSIPAPLPFGTPGAEVASELETREMQVLSRGAGRDVHAASADRRVQAVAVLAADSLVGLIYYHPETPQQDAMEVFARTAAGAERRFGPPTCRRSGLAVWPLEDGRLEVRLRGPRGDGAPGAEVRYLADGYADEIARRDAARRLARASRPSPAQRGSGPRLLGVPAAEAAPADPPAGDEGASADPASAASEAAAPVRPLCAE